MLSAYMRDPPARCRKLTPLGKLLIGYGMSMMALGCTAFPAGSKPVIVPDDVRTLSSRRPTRYLPTRLPTSTGMVPGRRSSWFAIKPAK